MRRKIILFLIIATISICKINAQYQVRFSNNYPPYNYLNENNELVGFNVEILNAIKELYKSDIQVDGDEWGVIINALKTNKIDAIGGFHFPGGPDPDYIYTRAAINTSHCFLYNKNFHNKFSLEFLRTSKEPLVAMWKHDVLIHYIQSINPATKFLFVKSYEDLIKATDREDVTCVFGQRTSAMYYAKKLNRTNVRALEHRILERSMGFRVSKETPELAKILNNGLEVILANGKYQEIYDTWIAEYNKNNDDWHNYLKYLLIASGIIFLLFLILLIINWILQTKIKNKTKDLTEQLALNSKIMVELKNEKDKAEESDKMKSAFLANMSHEIRTPMNGILGFTSLLKTVDYSSEKQAQFIDIIQKSGQRMLETINNIIEVSKLESGLEKPIIKEVDIEKNIKELCDFFTPEAATKGINLFFNQKNSTITTPFFTDEYKLNSILTNLIKNALKFTHKGSIEVTYKLSNTTAEFWIKDTGIGIPLEKQHFIFNEFVQADYSHSSGYEGSGLGLSISKGYVHLLNGEIKLTSAPNEGTTFYVSIPNTTTTTKTTKLKKTVIKKTTSELQNYKVLIAEDDETSFFYITSVLENLTKQIIRAKNGAEAVELVKNNNDIDVVLMDIKMPVLNGFEATKQIRKFNSTIYIVAQTAYIQESFKLQAQEAGCNSYISKPIDKQQLIKLLTKIKE
ncbi:ATP-binding protein [Lutibacter sp. A64]|uniref:response regulator n=1 Tax=Lutibacter sp. A64 TaxID=2918526 RepID=UPI001F06969D|nr:transporter substrate-binding domain-containing protein [Lutibacter sp. A64]UMB54722.1 ATP-binding protein [Lutibacter sp. A64]